MGYTRVFSNATSDTIIAEEFNSEFQLIDDAFDETSGHNHDGSTNNGAYVGTLSSSDNKDAVEIESVGHTVDIYINVAGVKTQQLEISDGLLKPVTDSDVDLGTSSIRFKDSFFDSVTTASFTLGASAITSLDTDISTVSASHDTIPSAKAVKTYVDAQVTAQDLDIIGDSGGALSIDLDSETLTLAGGTGIASVGGTNTITFNIDSTVATLTGTQTLTNKTLTSPILNGGAALTATSTELNFVDGVTSNIQTQIDGLASTSVTFEQLDSNGDVGTGAAQLAYGNHTHTGVYEPADATILKDADIGVTVAPAGTYLESSAIGVTVQGYDAVLAGTTESYTVALNAKLAGIETGADVTDTANVTAAGALMDSEVDADIKTLTLPASTTISTFGASLIDDASASAARTTLGLAIGTDVQAYDSTIVVDADIGTSVQAYDADTAKLDVVQSWTADQTFKEVTETTYNLTGTSIDPANGTVQYKTLTANTTLTVGSMANGQAVTVMVADGTSAYTATWTGVTWVGGSAPALPTTGYAVVELWMVGGTVYGSSVGDV